MAFDCVNYKINVRIRRQTIGKGTGGMFDHGHRLAAYGTKVQSSLRRSALKRWSPELPDRTKGESIVSSAKHRETHDPKLANEKRPRKDSRSSPNGNPFVNRSEAQACEDK